MAALLDETVVDLLHRHLALIQAPIPYQIPDSLTSSHILNRCGNLQVDLLSWRHNKDFPQQLADQLFEFSKQRHTPALTLQMHLALLVQQAIPK